MPVPPTALGPGFTLAHIGRTYRSSFADLLQHGLEPRFKIMTLPILIPAAQSCGIALSTHFPIWVIFHRDHRRIVGPVFKQGAITFIKRFQRLGAITLAPGKQDQVMCPRHGVDAVKLYKAQARYHLQKRGTMGGALWCIAQQMPMQKNPPGIAIAKRDGRHCLRLRRSVSPSERVGVIVTWVCKSGSGSSSVSFRMIRAAACPISSRQASIVAS